jgi:serine/threonine protein phosphatase 1
VTDQAAGDFDRLREPRVAHPQAVTGQSRRVIAIGDIHGCARALDELLRRIDPQPADWLIPLGDFIDRGPDTRGVLEQLLALEQRCRLTPLLGNHEEMLLAALTDRSTWADWLQFGGVATLDSYGFGTRPTELPVAHLGFLRRCQDVVETDTHVLVHANYLEDQPWSAQPGYVLRWESLDQRTPGAHQSGKTVVLGHTSQVSGDVLDLGYLKCIDTYCHGGGWLTALELRSGQTWQVNDAGQWRGTER